MSSKKLYERPRRQGLSGVPAMLFVAVLLLAVLSAAWVAARLLLSWEKLSSGWSSGALVTALVLAVVSFPIWLYIVLSEAAHVTAFWRRPWVRRELSKMATRIGARAGAVVTERRGGDGGRRGSFCLDILVVLPGSPDQVVGELVRRAAYAGYGGPVRPRVRRAPGRMPGKPYWEVDIVVPEEAARYQAVVAAGSTAVRVTLTERR